MGKGLPRFGFFIDAGDIDRHLLRLKAAGAVHSEPQRTTAYGDAGSVIFWQDPDGNQFEFWAPDVMPAGAMTGCGAERVGRISHGVYESRDLERTAAFFDRYCGVERVPAADTAPDTLVLRLAAGARLIFHKVDQLEGRTTGFGMPDPHTALIVREISSPTTRASGAIASGSTLGSTGRRRELVVPGANVSHRARRPLLRACKAR